MYLCPCYTYTKAQAIDHKAVELLFTIELLSYCVSFSDTYYAWIRRAVLEHFCNFSKPTPFQPNWTCNKQLHMAVIEEPCSAPLTNDEWED